MVSNVPILLTAFNRPELFQRNLNSLREYGVNQLFIATDGPRKNNSEDRASCEAIIGIIEEARRAGIHIVHLSRSENLGCQMAISGAITWFFNQVEYGIIIEDDCLVSPSFIKYSQELLECYKDHTTIMHISGSNFLNGKLAGNHSYYFSAIPHIWGWATWKRAWENYDPNISADIVDQLDGYFEHKKDRERYRKEFENTASGKLDTWDYRWFYSIWKRRGLCITPGVNMVSNIGFGEKATHTTQENNSLSAIKIEEMKFPISHPKSFEINTKADNALYNKHFRPRKSVKSVLFSHILGKLKSHMPVTYGKLKALKKGY